MQDKEFESQSIAARIILITSRYKSASCQSLPDGGSKKL
jgi:hypothetical protein